MTDIETNSKCTPIEELVALFNTNNSTTLNIHNLVCNQCKTWLMKPIYLTKEGFNVCGTCADKSDSIENKSLELLLEDTVYPCKNKIFGCMHVDKLISAHELSCKYHIYCYCQELVGTPMGLIKHLKEKHAMETQDLKKPVAEISIKNQSSEQYPVLLQAGRTKLIVLLRLSLSMPTLFNGEGCLNENKRTVSQCEISVSVLNGTMINRNMKYTLKLFINQREYILHGAVLNNIGNLKYILPSRIVLPLQPVKIKLYLDNYDNFEAVDQAFEEVLKEFECPVCLEPIIGKCYQCNNGHNLCQKCRVKIGACPVCRLQLSQHSYNTRNFTSQLQRFCRFSTNGCFKFECIANITTHENNCVYKLVTCGVCKVGVIDKAALRQHMLQAHGMQFMGNSSRVVKPGYIALNGSVFELSFQITPGRIKNSRPTIITIKWELQLIHAAVEGTSYNYKLIIDMFDYLAVIDRTIGDNDSRELKIQLNSVEVPSTIMLNLVEKAKVIIDKNRNAGVSGLQTTAKTSTNISGSI